MVPGWSPPGRDRPAHRTRTCRRNAGLARLICRWPASYCPPVSASALDPGPAAGAPPRQPLGFEAAIVIVLALALLVPGIWTYSLVDPWETHYGEVARRMLQDHDWVHTTWQAEGFRSKPVLTFWLQAAAMKTLGVADGGGYSGELTATMRTMLAIRLPFALFGVLGLTSLWYMLARLVSRRTAWLGFLVVGTCPFYALVARQGITDMTLVGCMLGALACFALAVAGPARPVSALAHVRLPWLGRVPITGLHLILAVGGGFVLAQAAYYAAYFTAAPQLAGRIRFPSPAVVLPAFMLIGLAALHGGWARALVGEHEAWDGHRRPVHVTLLGLRRVATMRQVYLLGFYVLLGVSLLGKGLPALGIIGVVAFFYVALLGRWRDLWDGRFELKRGILLIVVIAVPWHLAMYLKDGLPFIREYFITHLWNRAAAGVFGERGTFDFYLSQVGIGMFVWAALVPAALGALASRTRWPMVAGRPAPSAEATVRFLVGVWASAGVAFFVLVQTKFHHYILPAVPALALMVAFFLDDVWAGRARLRWPAALLGVGILLLLTRDLMHEEKQWIEMFVFRYDRPWPTAEPWAVDTSDGFLVLGLVGAGALLLLASPLRRLGVIAVLVAGLLSALWAMHVYMPLAGRHWGMRDAVARYYRERQIHGLRQVYFGGRQLADAWAGRLAEAERTGAVTVTFGTVVPDHLHEGQPMTVRVSVNKASDVRTTEADVRLPAVVSAIGEASVTVRIERAALAPLTPLVAAGRSAPRAPRRPLELVDGDRLLIWNGYWRDEVFWSGDKIYGFLPEYQTDWQLNDSDGKKLVKYLSDRTLAPLGRRYYVLTSGNVSGLRGLLPTQRGKDTLETIDTTGNKFSLGRFEL